LSPNSVSGRHDTLGELPHTVVEAIHRIRTDPARLSRAWFENVIADGLSDAQYVELVGVVALLAGVDSFARAIGIAWFELPEPLPGEPSRNRPSSAKPETAWVPMIAPEDADGPEAMMRSDDEVLGRERRTLRAVLSDESFVDVAATIGAFNVVTRIADSTGIPLDPMLESMSVDVSRQLNLTRFASSANTPEAR
jgi:hypothetical protein